MQLEQPLKVCFVSSIRCPKPLKTTDEKKFRLLSSLGEIFVIGFSENLLWRQFTQYAHFYLLPQLPLPVLRYLEMFVVTPWLVLWLILRHQVWVFVAQSPFEGTAVVLAKKIAHWFGHPIVLIVESHGDFEEALFMQRRISFPALYRTLMKTIARLTIWHADLLRAVSDSTRQQLERWKSDQPVFQFFAWTDVESFQKIGAARTPQGSQTFVYAGVLIPRKGVVHLVKAFAGIAADFPQARLLIIGKEENRIYAAEVKALATQLGLDQQVQFIPELPQQQLAQYMGQASALVLPSYSEGLPRVVFEAMLAGLPTIATAVSGIPEIVQEGVTGFLLQPGDESALADKMRWILLNPESVWEMGRTAYTFACAHFSPEAYLHGYRQMFQAAQARVPVYQE